MIFIIASVCFQLHVFGTRHGRCVDRENREIRASIVWLNSDAVMEWERPTAAAQDANRRWTRWFFKASGTHFLPCSFPAERKNLPTRGGRKNLDQGWNKGSGEGSLQRNGQRHGRLKRRPGVRRAFGTGGAALFAPALGPGENAQSTVVPALRERPRKALRGGWRKIRCIPRSKIPRPRGG